MRKNALAMSIATLIGGLGFVGAASADVVVPGGAMTAAPVAASLVVNNGGVGHALITPYFSAQNGNATLISIVNTDITFGKAIKIRFRGASNSDDILDFTILMSPGDVWNATVTPQSATGLAQISTGDRTCTLPQLAPNVAQPFVTNRLTARDTINGVNANTREGYVEIFNMANIIMTSALGKTIAHSAGVPKCDGPTINAAILTTNWTTNAQVTAAGLDSPSTGLFGDWAILNVPQTTTYSGQMVAIRAVDGTGADAVGNYVLFPQSGSAYVPPGGQTVDWVTADPLLRTAAGATKDASGVLGGVTALPAIAAAFFDMPDMSTPYFGAVSATAPLTQAGNLTAALAVKSIANEYSTEPSLSGRTDWTFSMPTRRYSVAMNYAASPSSIRLFSIVPFPAAPNNQYFYTGNTAINTANSQQICVTAAGQVFWDREEGTKTSGAVFSPGFVTNTQFCGEASVLSFGAGLTDPSALGASVARQDTGASAFTNGWGNVNVVDAVTSLGLPIIGSAFLKATNPAASAGFAGTYGLSFEHRFTR